MPIVGGLDIHRKQITFDYPGTVTGEVRRGQVAPADRQHLRAWLARFAGCADVAFAVEGCAGWRYAAEELAAAGIAAHLGKRPAPPRCGAVSGTPRPTRPTRRTCRRCWPRGGLPMLDPAGADPGVPGAAGDLPRPAARARRLGPAHPCGVLPPGRATAGRGSFAHRAGPGRAAGGHGRAPVAGRAAAGRHRLGHARRRRNPAGPAAPAAAGCRSAPEGREGAGREDLPKVWEV